MGRDFDHFFATVKPVFSKAEIIPVQAKAAGMLLL